MIKSIRPSPFVAHVLLTSAASLATIAANVFVLRFLAQGFGIERFGAYSLACRLSAVLQPFATLTLGIALSRFLSLSADERTRRQYLLAGFLLGMAPNLFILAAGFLGKSPLARLIFHGAGDQNLFLLTLLWVTAFFVYSILDGFYFGTGQIKKANLWQIFLGSLGPLLVALIFSKRGRVEEVVLSFGVLYFLALPPLAFHLFLAMTGKPEWTQIRFRMRELWAYAAPRFPVRFVLAGLFSVGPFLAPYFGSLQDAGFLMVGLMVFRLAELGSTAFGRVVLPKAGELLSEGRREYLKEKIEDIIAFVFHVGFFVTVQLILWCEQIILIWLGPEFTRAIPLMQALTLAVAPYLLFIMLSPVIDALEEKPVNLYNLLLAFAVALAVSGIGGKLFSVAGLAFGTVLGLTALGFMTVSYLWRVCGVSLKGLQLKKVFLANLVFLLLSLILKDAFTARWEGIGLITTGAAMEIILLASYIFVLWKMHPRWLGELESRLFSLPQKAGLKCP